MRAFLKRYRVDLTLAAMLFAAVLSTVAFGATVPTVTVHWTAPTLNADGSAVAATESSSFTYNLYQATQGSPLVQVQTGLKGSSAVVSAGLPIGTTQCFAITTVRNDYGHATEGAQSSQACIDIPVPAPGVLTQLTVVIVMTGS